MLVEILKTVLSVLRSISQSRAALLAENVVLRQQIIVLHRSVPKPRFRARDRVVLALAARVFGPVCSGGESPDCLLVGLQLMLTCGP